MKAAHTSGPWRYQEESDAYTHIVRGPKGEFVVSAPQDTSGTAEANARLIAAAPEMLEALEAAQSYIRCQQPSWAKAEDLPPVMHELSAAIEKARTLTPSNSAKETNER